MDYIVSNPINARGVATRERMLDVAEALIAARGVAGVSTRQIAAAAGQANHSAVRHHFRDKETLVRAILVERAARIEALRSALIANMPKPLTANDAIVALVRPLCAFMGSASPDAHYFRFLEQATRHFGLARAAAEVTSAPGLAACIAALTQTTGSSDCQQTRTYLIIGMIFRGFADREQARAEGMLIVDDDGQFGTIMIAAAQAALG
jgi:AcrR family transcriptional regulator